jgi:hypothetical protein
MNKQGWNGEKERHSLARNGIITKSEQSNLLIATREKQLKDLVFETDNGELFSGFKSLKMEYEFEYMYRVYNNGEGSLSSKDRYSPDTKFDDPMKYMKEITGDMEREYDDTLWQQSEHFPLYWEMKQWISDYTSEPVKWISDYTPEPVRMKL